MVGVLVVLMIIVTIASDGDAVTTEEPAAEPEPVGTRSNPILYGAATAVTWDVWGDADGSTWDITIRTPRDWAEALAAADEFDFDDPPPEGAAFAAFDVEMTLVSAAKEPLSQGFNFGWEILGGTTKAVYGSDTLIDLFGCGISQPGSQFERHAEVFVGGTIAGTVCIPIPVEDLDHPDTLVAMNFSGDRVYFGSN